MTTSDGFTGVAYQHEAWGDGVVSCALTAPDTGVVYNSVTVYVVHTRQGPGSFPNVIGATCPSEASDYGTPGVRSNSTNYFGTSQDVTSYANGTTFVDNTSCGYSMGWQTASYTWNTNPNTGVAWTYNDLINLELVVKGNEPDNSTGGYVSYYNATYAYVVVSATTP